MSINPKLLKGNWDEGWVLDLHTLSSVPIGENAYGHMEFETTRTELGEQVFLLKNRNKIQALDKILELIKPFLDSCSMIKNVDTIIPVPPTSKNRLYQPTFEIAYAISEYTRKSYVEDVLIKTNTLQSKNISNKENLKGSIVANKKAKRKNNVLLVDDLISSGMTLKQCVDVLRNDDNVIKIYVLAMTKTRR